MANISIYCTRENIKSAYNNNKSKISAPTWNDEFDLSDGSCSILDIDYYFEYNIKEKRKTKADNLPIQIYIDKTKNRVVFKIETSFKLELWTKETIRLPGSTEKVTAKDKNGKNVPKLKILYVILMHCNYIINALMHYQEASKVLFTFVSDKQFRQLITYFNCCTSFINNVKNY